jgi:competence protein ComEC
MPFYDRSIDVVIETHPDADHIGGLVDVLARYHVGVFLEPGIKSQNAIDEKLEQLRKQKGIKGIYVRRGLIIDFRDGVYFKTLFPDRNVGDFKETNDASIVGQVAYGSTSIMLTGDSTQKIEKYLVATNGALLRSDVLKVGHHGSKYSSGVEYVKAIAPKYAVISVGAHNRYGHPSKEVLSVFSMLDIPVLRTDELGTIHFISDGSAFLRK